MIEINAIFLLCVLLLTLVITSFGIIAHLKYDNLLGYSNKDTGFMILSALTYSVALLLFSGTTIYVMAQINKQLYTETQTETETVNNG